MEPKVAVLIVNYNGAADTIECLQSLEKIVYKNVDIIVIDNGSVDNSIKVLENYKGNFHLLKSNSNMGFAGGNNIGIRYAVDHGADYVLLLNNDTVVDPGFIEPLVQTAQTINGIGAVGGKIYYYNDPKRIWFAGGLLNKYTAKTKHIGKNKYDFGQYDTVQEVDFITGCMILVPGSVIEQVGLLDEKYFLYYEDVDWNISIKNYGYKLVYNPFSKIFHKESSSTRKLDNIKSYYYYRNIYYFVCKHFSRPRRWLIRYYLRVYFLLIILKNLMFLNTEKVRIMKEVCDNMSKMSMGPYKTIRIHSH